MSTILVLIVITFQIRMFSGIGNETIKVKVEKGDTVVLKCSDPEGKATWSGPDVNNVGQRVELYFSNNDKNPKLNLTEYSLEIEGKYNLIIANFLEKNAGSYICSFTKDGSFRETKYHVCLLFTKSKKGNKEQNSVILLVLIPVVLIGGSFAVIGLLARVRGITVGEMLGSFLLVCRRDTERHTAIDKITEQDNTVENQLYQNSNDPPNGNPSEPDADLDVSEDTGDTSNHRNTNASTAVRLHECTPGLHYAEVLIKPVESQHIKIHGIENRTIYTGIDHSLKRETRQSDHSDNDSEDDFIYNQNFDVNSRNYENTCL